MLDFLKRNPLFLRYWMGTWFSELGDWLRNMAVMYIVLELFSGSAMALSATMFAEYAPIFLFGPIIGVIADRWHRKRTIAGANLFRAIIMGVFFVAVWFQLLWLIFAAAFLSAIGTLFFRAPGSSFIMQFVLEEDRKTAASLRQLSLSVMIMMGPLVGTSIYMFIGGAWTFAITTLLFVVSAWLISTVKVVESEADVSVEKKQGMRAVWEELKQGLQYSFQHPIVRPILFGAVFVGFGGGVIQVLEVFIVTDFLGLPKTMVAVLASAQGVGMLCSTFLVQKLKIRTDHFVSWGMMVMGLGLSAMVIYPLFIVTAGGLVIFSLGQIALNIGMATLMQTKVSYEYQGRVGMTFQTAMMGFMTFALLTTGWIYEVLPIQALVAGGGMIVIFGGFLCYMMFRRVSPTLLGSGMKVEA
jgi:MFS family permease